MSRYVLTDVARDIWLETFSLGAGDLGLPSTVPWSITKRRLRGGRRDGVDLVTLNNGVLSLSVVPTRGMNLWRGQYRGDALGWSSPVRDGPIHPSHIDLNSQGGLGWLDGFDELLARCGLESNGAPFITDSPLPGTIVPLHGRISNRPAHAVAVEVDPGPPLSLIVEGQVDEARLFAPQIRMITRLQMSLGSNRVLLRDEFVNLGDTPGEIQVLYHWNFGPPYLGDGAQMILPSQTIVPRDARAQEGLDTFATYGPPEPGFTEQVYFFQPQVVEAPQQTLAMLRNPSGDKAVVLGFQVDQLPCFTLWKQTGGPNEGYVTGLEPGTNYPNPLPFEKRQGRVVTLAPRGRFVVEQSLELLDSAEAVAQVEHRLQTAQQGVEPTLYPTPAEPFSPA